MKFVDVQREEFKRLGVRGDWDDPYLTLNHSYEAGNVRVFAKMYRARRDLQGPQADPLVQALPHRTG